ncbi:hypothetical protein EW026_g2124 [Hermanssonia centrifuga]|uniref:Uncharacterized protein n=1 Tax=Hermanssonia centrifuga TaxID=98765 RepID=A0A4S4KQ80_9APHY|nr:hypothetical protein EW026_g2124 [Hermanssonia centrifuga]
MLCVGKLRTNAEEEEREKTGQTGRQGFTSTWKRNELERKVSGILEKIGKEVGVNDIVSRKQPQVFPLIGGNQIKHMMSNINALKITVKQEHIKEIETHVKVSKTDVYHIQGVGLGPEPESVLICSARSISHTPIKPVRKPGPSALDQFQLKLALFRSLAGSSRRWLATAPEVASASVPPPPPATSDPRITKIVDDISGLTLLQAADLISALKSRLNISEIAMPAAAPAAAAPAAAEEAPVEKVKEKTVFNVKLESFDAGAKSKIIREVKTLVPGLTLIDAKKFVESAPKILRENLSKEDAEKMKKTFTDLGAVIVLE